MLVQYLLWNMGVPTGTHGPSFMEAKGGWHPYLYKWISCAFVSILQWHPSASYMNSVEPD